MADDRTDRMYPERPMVGVAAVVLHAGAVLLAKRGKPPALGSWSLPGGLIEVGETVEEAVRREVREECGIEVEVGPILGVFEPVHNDPDGRVRYHFVVLDYLAHYVAGEPRAGDDAAEIMWCTPGDLAGVDLNPATRRMIERGFAAAGGN